MITKLKLERLGLSPLEQALVDATSEVDNAQTNYDEALDLYAARHARVEFDALNAKEWVDKDGNPRSAANDLERRAVQKMKCAQDEILAGLRKTMRESRRLLKLWQMREKDYRAILNSRAAEE